MRRGTISKSKSKYVNDSSRLEDGVNGRHVCLGNGPAQRPEVLLHL